MAMRVVMPCVVGVFGGLGGHGFGGLGGSLVGWLMVGWRGMVAQRGDAATGGAGGGEATRGSSVCCTFWMSGSGCGLAFCRYLSAWLCLNDAGSVSMAASGVSMGTR